MKDTTEEIQRFLESIPDKFEILEEKIDLQIQKEYIDYSENFDRGELSEKETLQLSEILFKNDIPLEAKKKGLTILAHTGTVLAFRQIEKYYNNPDKELKQWSALALQECKMFLESELTDLSTGFISTGLGGLINKLRYYYLILPSSEKGFDTTQNNIIKDEFNIIANELDSLIETIEYSEKFIEFKVLVPLDIAVGNLIETGINKCNELGNFVFEHYYVTNQDIPDREEIKEIIRIVRDE